MLEIIFWTLIGAFIGWNFPQPSWAKNFQSRYLVPFWDWLKTKIPLIP